MVAVAFSNDGKWVVCGGMDGRVKVYKKDGSGDNWGWVVDLEGPDEVIVRPLPSFPFPLHYFLE